MEKKILTVAFLTPAEDDPWMNRATAKLGKHPFCHVKLVFDFGSRTSEGFSIQHGEIVTLRRTKLTNPGYKTISLALPLPNYQKIRAFCENTSSLNITFDNVGMCLASFHPGMCANIPSTTIGCTFCSKIVCEALQAGDMAETVSLCPSACTPARLYTALQNSPSQILFPIRVPNRLCM